MNSSRSRRSCVGVEERLPRQRGIEVAGEQFERGAAQPGQPRRLRSTNLHVHRGIDHGQDAIEALHDVPPGGTDRCRDLHCAATALRPQSGEVTSEST